jgi:hypothetical protein
VYWPSVRKYTVTVTLLENETKRSNVSGTTYSYHPEEERLHGAFPQPPPLPHPFQTRISLPGVGVGGSMILVAGGGIIEGGFVELLLAFFELSSLMFRLLTKYPAASNPAIDITTIINELIFTV